MRLHSNEGAPMINPSEINDPMSLDRALRALLHGGDEDPYRSTRATGWNDGIGGDAAMKASFPFEWTDELGDIDLLISEEVAAPPTPLPTASLLERIDDMTVKLSSWFSAALPDYHKRLMRYAFDEMAEIGGLLRGGVINADEASNRFNAVMAEVDEVVDFSRFEE